MTIKKIVLVNNNFENQTQTKALKKISLFGFFALTGAAIMNIFMYPQWATSGLTTILFLLVGGILWFIPVALCAAEMATVKEWKHNGGLYHWTMMVLGKKWGWSAIFFQWFQITIAYYILLNFSVCGMFYMANDPQYLNYTSFSKTVALQHEAVVWAIMILLFVCLTCFNLFGVKFNDIFSSFALPTGILLPAILISIFGFWAFFAKAGGNGYGNANWIPTYDQVSGHVTSQLTHGIFPKVATGKNAAWNNLEIFVIFSNFVISYTGIEQSASLIRQMKNSKKNYPVAVILVALLIITLGIFGSVAIAMTLQNNQGDLCGIYDYFLQLIISHNIFGLSYHNAIMLYKFLCFLALLGGICESNAVIIQPSTGIYHGFEDMQFSKWFTKTNRFDAHYIVLLLQSVLMLFWTTILNFISTNDLGFQLCINLAVLTYMFAYCLLFIAYFKLNFGKNHALFHKNFEVKTKPLKILVSGIGFLLTIFIMIIILAPPQLSPSISVKTYTNTYLPTLLILYFLCISLPFGSYYWNFHKLFYQKIVKTLIQQGLNRKKALKIYRQFKNNKQKQQAINYLKQHQFAPQIYNYYEQ